MRTEKRCCKCGAVKPLAAFNKRRALRDGRAAMCRECHAAYSAAYVVVNAAKLSDSYRRRKYGLDKAGFSRLYALQDGKCGICRRLLVPRGAQSRQPHVDHDHRTKKVRGLLCGPCNRGLGMFQDRPPVLRAAAAYLEKC